MHRLFLLAIVGLPLAGLLVAAAHVLLHCGRLIDGASDTPRESVTLVISRNRITAIESGFSLQFDQLESAGRGQFLLPPVEG